MQEIKLKFLFVMLVPGCRGNYVPPGFKANLQPLTPLWDYWPLGPYQQKINQVLISGAHPGTSINVMYTRVWGGPRATKHTKMPPNEEAGLPTELS